MKNHLFLFYTLLIFGCDSNTDDEFKKLTVHYIENIQLSKLIENDIQYIPITESKDTIQAIDKILFNDTIIYVLDRKYSKKVHAINIDGNTRFTFGVLGSGEGEYGDPSHIGIVKKELHLFDNSNMSLLKYDLNGNFKEEIKLNFWIDEFLSIDDYIIAYCPSSFNKNTDFGSDVLKVLSSDYVKLENSFFPYVEVLENVCGPGQINLYDNQVNYMRSYLGEIWSLKNNSLSPRFKIDFGKYSWPIEIDSLINDEEKFIQLFIDEEVMSLMHDVYETDRFLVFKTYMTNADLLGPEDVWFVIHEKSTSVCYAIHNIENDIDSLEYKFPLTTWENSMVSYVKPKFILNKDQQPNAVLMKYTFKSNLDRFID
jgi:hypothetical protein